MHRLLGTPAFFTFFVDKIVCKRTLLSQVP